MNKILCSLFTLCLALLASAPVRAGATLDALTDANQPIEVPALQVARWHTPAGTPVLFVRSQQLPMFDVQVIFAAGSAYEQGVAGLAQLTLGMLDEGTLVRDASAFAEALDDTGAVLHKSSGRERVQVHLRSLSHDPQRTSSIDLLVEMLGQPLFAEPRLAPIKDQLNNLIAHSRHYAAQRASDLLNVHLYPGHPYSANPLGEPDAIAGISIEQIKAYYQRAFTASNATIVLVGDLSHEQARQMAEHIAGTLPTGPALPSIPAPAATEPELYHLEHPGTQTTLLVGLPAPAANHPDRAALTVLNQILGGKGLRTRLMHELRTRRGLTYGAYSRLQLQRSAGIWGMQLGVEHRYRDATLHVVEQLLHDYVEHGPTQQELDDTRRKLLGELLLASASNAGKLAQLQDIAFNQLAPDHQAQFINAIQALSIDQLKVVLKNHLQIDKLVQISVGPLSDQEPLPTHTTD